MNAKRLTLLASATAGALALATSAFAQLAAGDLAKLGTTLTPMGAEKAGNAAGTGARIALLNKKGRDEIESVVRRIEKIETAVEPTFQQHFVEAMAIPHKTARFANLARAVTLPAPKDIQSTDESGGGRRRRRG